MALRSLSTSALYSELARREKEAAKLRSQRDKLATQLDSLDSRLAQIEDGGGGARRGPRKATTARAGARKKTGRKKTGARGKSGRRPGAARGGRRTRNAMNLPDAIAAVMDKGKVASPKEAAALVKRNGFKTTSKNFNMMVSNAMAKDKRFKRLSRGQYERVK